MGRPRKYTELQRQVMADLYLSGMSLSQVGEVFGTSYTTIHYILHGMGVSRRAYKEAVTDIGRAKLRAIHTGRQHSPEEIEKRRQSHIGKKRSAEFRRRMSEGAKARGTSHNFFVDGKGKERSKQRKQEMDGLEYRLWREAVFERDNFTCQDCQTRGGTLRADHVKPWATHPELRYDAGNGRTLCDECHKKTDTYGGKMLRSRG